MWVEFLILTLLALYLFHRWANAKNDFFKKRGIPYAKPKPLFGNFMQMLLRKKSFFDLVNEIYNKHDGKIYGVFDQRSPLFLIRDPELIKQITIKDFDHFVNHRATFSDDGDQGEQNLFGASLVMMKDAKWKDMRSTLSPAFTGSKMRSMFQLMNEVAENALAYMKQQPGVHTEEGLDVQVKEFITRFTNDIIASTAFGLQVDSYSDTENEFFKMGRALTKFSFKQTVKFMMFINFKKLMKFLRIQLFDKKYTDYFMKLVLDAMKYRQENNIIRPDMINLLMEARGMFKGQEHSKALMREWSDIDIVGQCFLFFFAGFETSAALTCFTAHEIMENSDVQEKLLQEILDVEEQMQGKPLSYEALMGMRYMDMVVQECLRKWPAAIALDRACNKDITYDLGDGQKLELKKGDNVWIPVVGFHRDPKYFENPLKFDPERFSEANKHKINPFVYLPFGIGPRNCIGSRFALLETKVLIYYLLRDFKFEAAKKSCIPIKLNPSGFTLIPKEGFWIKFNARS